MRKPYLVAGVVLLTVGAIPVLETGGADCSVPFSCVLYPGQAGTATQGATYGIWPAVILAAGAPLTVYRTRAGRRSTPSD